HNNKLFIEKFSISDLNIIFKNYQNLKPEQFLTSLTMEDLTENEIEIINKLRNKYSIADSMINIMIDFSIRKTHNELNSKYLYKMAKSFNIENIDSLNKAYDFLFNWDNKIKNNQFKEEKKLIKRIDVQKEEIVENDNDYQVPIYEFEL
ncbi:MAG: DnaD domain protein, partial [Malacoplasma sp.]|nr:DnaD domain protein [Malacoplasma sp.]